MKELPHDYRNRPDDDRPIEGKHYCETCNGFYGVPHETIHEPRFKHPDYAPIGGGMVCACRPCREGDGLSREGRYGSILSQQEATRLLPAT